MHHFCTYFDVRYLPRGLTLHESLRKHSPGAILWVLCLDSETYTILTELDIKGIHPIALDAFLEGDEPLQAARKNRSVVEFYFTCSPSLPLYLLNKNPEIDRITYLDADLYFFSSPEPLFEEMGDRSIAVTPHRHPPELKHHDAFGLYNVGWLSFRRDETGLACLNWWRDRCNEWCYDREEDGKFADQKYLDHWPELFKSVAILNYPGANLAAWNVSATELRHEDGSTSVDGQALIFYHFHNLTQINAFLYEMAFKVYGINPCFVLRQYILSPYLTKLRVWEKEIEKHQPSTEGTADIRYRPRPPQNNQSLLRRSARRLKAVLSIIKGIFSRKYFLYLGRRIL